MHKVLQKLFFLVLAIFLVLLVEGVFQKPPAPYTATPDDPGISYVVRQVVDGDTIVVEKAGAQETVRVLGIDTPETQYSERGEECYSAEATERARALLLHTQVVLHQDETQAERDAYDRLLAYVELADSTDFGARMIEEGYAKEYTFKGQAYERQSTYKRIEEEAQESSIGLWACE